MNRILNTVEAQNEVTVPGAAWRLSQAALRTRRVRIWALAVAAILALLSLQSLFPSLQITPTLGGPLGTVMTLAIFCTALVCEYIDSSLGMGYGTTLTPLLLLIGFEPLQIVPAVLFSEFVTGLFAGVLHHRDGNVDFLRDRQARGTALLLSVLSVVGATAAVSLALRMPEFWLKAIIAIIVLSVGVVILATVRRRLRYRRSHIIVLGAVAAFNKGLSGGGYGPLVTGGQMVSGVPAKHAVAITSLTESLTCLVGLVGYAVACGPFDWALGVPLGLGAICSVPIATLTVRNLPERAIRGGVGALTCVLGALALAKLVL
jgi:uncharacterized membrane protein YfcA